MTEPEGEDTVRVWLVERTYTDRDLIVLSYATPDGERRLRKEQSASIVAQPGRRITAARDVDPERLTAVDEDATRERYAMEAARMAERHDPDDEV